MISEHFAGLDLVLTEGFKRGPYPKIEVHRAARSSEILCEPQELLTIVTDEPLAVDTPQFGLEDAGGVADLLIIWLGKQT